MQHAWQYDDEMMIMVLQKVKCAVADRTKPPTFGTDDEECCCNYAMQSGFVNITQAGNDWVVYLTESGLEELNRLIREKPAREREKALHERDAMHLQYVKEQAQYAKKLTLYSFRSLIVSGITLFASIIYFGVTAWVLLHPTRPVVYNTIVQHHKNRQYDTPHETQIHMTIDTNEPVNESFDETDSSPTLPDQQSCPAVQKTDNKRTGDAE